MAGTGVPPQDPVGSPRAIDATLGPKYGQIFSYPNDSNPSDICGREGAFPNSKTAIPNDECIAKIFETDPPSGVIWDDNPETEVKFQSLYVITKAASDPAPKLYFAEGDNQQQGAVRATAFSNKFFTKSTTN